MSLLRRRFIGPFSRSLSLRRYHYAPQKSERLRSIPRSSRYERLKPTDAWPGSLSSGRSTDSPDSVLNARFFTLDDVAARAAYMDLWEISPQRSVFAHPTFLEAVGEAFRHPVRLAAVEDGNSWLAAVPVFEKRRGPFLAAALPHVTPILSPLLRARIDETETNHRRSALDALLGALAETYHQVTLQLHPSIVDARPFAWSGWTVAPRYTHIADLSVNDPLSAWSRSVRYTVRTESERFRVEESHDFAEAGIALMQAGYDRKGTPLGLPKSVLTAIVRQLAEEGYVRVFAATRHGIAFPEAVVIIAHDGRTAHYWIAGSTPGPAMGVLLATVVPKLKDADIASLDFAGANVPSVAEFKRKYGAVLYPYFRVRCVSNPLLRILDRLRPHQ